ncbi:MAG: glutathione S-transferase family protein, partial [Symploca sp. SIO1C4]|nr:glutathione S-transferase family protein [Symploca sp. SIO1C4]
NLADYPHLQRWFDDLNARPAVQRGLAILKDRSVNREMDKEARENLFGTRQLEKQ